MTGVRPGECLFFPDLWQAERAAWGTRNDPKPVSLVAGEALVRQDSRTFLPRVLTKKTGGGSVSTPVQQQRGRTPPLPALRAPMELRNSEDLARLMRLQQHSVRTLAELAGLHRSTIHRLRHDPQAHCNLDTATAIAEALNVAVDALFRPATKDGSSQSME